METMKTLFLVHHMANNYIHMVKRHQNLFLMYIKFQQVYEHHYLIINLLF